MLSKKILQTIHRSQDIFLSNNFILDICLVCKQEYKRYDGKTKILKAVYPVIMGLNNFLGKNNQTMKNEKM
jgi:hypothetical protein